MVFYVVYLETQQFLSISVIQSLALTTKVEKEKIFALTWWYVDVFKSTGFNPGSAIE